MNTNSNFDREDDEIIFKEKEHFSVMPFFQDAFPYFLYSEKWYKKNFMETAKSNERWNLLCFLLYRVHHARNIRWPSI